MSEPCPDCDKPIVRGKHNVAYNLNPKDGLLHRQSCTNPAPVKSTETEASVRRQLRL